MAVGRVHHPGERAVEFTNFLSCNGAYTNFSLRSDSCLCDACYRDCTRASGKPRWLKLSEHSVYKHCILCCEGQLEDCSCKRVLDWGPPIWYDNAEEFQLWIQYFQCTGYRIIDDGKHSLCKSHYILVLQIICNHLCSVCKGTSSDKWTIGQNLIKGMGSSYSVTDVGADDRVCEHCYNSLVWPKSSSKKRSKFSEARSETLEYSLKTLEADGACMIKSMMNMYKTLVVEKNECTVETGEHESFKRILKMHLSSKGYKFYSRLQVACVTAPNFFQIMIEV